MVTNMKLALLAALTLQAETRVSIDQIRNWQQVRNPNTVGTAVAISQLRIPPDVMEVWERAATEPHDHFRVAVVIGQQYPILITCRERVSSCAQWHPLTFNKESK
jgi:hypothetical protein